MSPTTPASSPELEALAVGVPTADGRSTRWDDHRAARRAELVRAARRAVHRHGPDVSMEEIAATAATSKSIVYRYFGDKSALQVAVGQAVVAQMHTALDEAVHAAATPRDGLRAMIHVYLEMVEGSPNVYYFVTRPVSEDASVPLGHFLDAVATLIARPFVQVLTADRGARVTAAAATAAAARPHPAASPDAAAGAEPAANHLRGLADVWAAGAVGFVRGAGEWWLSHRDEPDAAARDELTERVTAWLWAGPVSALRTRPDTTTPAEERP